MPTVYNHIKLPYSETSSSAPSSSRIEVGELWLNGADNIIGTKKQDGSIIKWSQLTPSEKSNIETGLANTVNVTGDQAVAGVKTFSSSPIVPTPEIDDDSTKVATTAWVNDAVQPAGDSELTTLMETLLPIPESAPTNNDDF